MADHNITPKEQFEYAWKHFSFIADQRIRTFNFYVILLAASLGATVTVFEKLPRFKPLLGCGVWHLFIGAMFLIIDVRSRKMLETPKAALRWFEGHDTWVGPKQIVRDDVVMEGWSRWFSFTTAFRLTFYGQMIFGTSVIVYAVAYF